MARSVVLTLALPALITLGVSCSSNSINTAPATFAQATVPVATTAPAATSLPVTGVTVASSSPKGMIGGAQSVGCDTDLGTMETAVESFFALNGRYPDSEAELVLTGLLVEQSVFHDVGPDGAVIPSPSAGCVR